LSDPVGENLHSERRHPGISIIIPTFNRGELTARAVESVLAQTYPAYEIVVIDDGSTDNTRELLLRRFENRIRYVYQTNRGPGAARNTGIYEAGQEWVAFLDSDDVWLPGKLEIQFSHLSLEGLVLSYGNWLDGKTPRGKDYFSKIGLRLPQTSLVFDDPLSLLTRRKGSGIWTTTCICRKSAVLKAGGFDENYRVGEDLRLWFRMSFEGKFAVTSEILAERAWLGPDRQLTDTKKEAYFREAAGIRTEIFMETYGRAMQTTPEVQKELRRLLAECLADQAKFAARDGRWRIARRRAFESLTFCPKGKSAIKALFSFTFPRLWGLLGRRQSG